TREANRKLYGIEEPTNFTGASQTQKSGPAAPVPPSRSTTEASGVVPSNQPQTQEGPGLPEPSPRAAGNQTAVGDSSALATTTADVNDDPVALERLIKPGKDWETAEEEVNKK